MTEGQKFKCCPRTRRRECRGAGPRGRGSPQGGRQRDLAGLGRGAEDREARRRRRLRRRWRWHPGPRAGDPGRRGPARSRDAPRSARGAAVAAQPRALKPEPRGRRARSTRRCMSAGRAAPRSPRGSRAARPGPLCGVGRAHTRAGADPSGSRTPGVLAPPLLTCLPPPRFRGPPRRPPPSRGSSVTRGRGPRPAGELPTAGRTRPPRGLRRVNRGSRRPGHRRPRPPSRSRFKVVVSRLERAKSREGLSPRSLSSPFLLRLPAASLGSVARPGSGWEPRARRWRLRPPPPPWRLLRPFRAAQSAAVRS